MKQACAAPPSPPLIATISPVRLKASSVEREVFAHAARLRPDKRATITARMPPEPGFEAGVPGTAKLAGGSLGDAKGA